ncbi:hypothetical protein F4813DRAFT_352205 [Daldinia decipiens]|uniref:uncharacterized protein n=1 Tax=Daldinia decipiens TaxID=326647 RepID=UPI0020C2205D|nr:uncharacterized protein F4813DRAFT_352205 [Daldinia decipiens]KAI1659878.1 hypothetical protein F4813DRAFT_352205 [Daldinia decipiens]
MAYGVIINKYEEDISNRNAIAISLDGHRLTADIVIDLDNIRAKSQWIKSNKLCVPFILLVIFLFVLGIQTSSKLL